MNISIVVDADKEKKYLKSVFKVSSRLPEEIFENHNNFDYIIIDMDEYLFPERNTFFQKILHNFFKDLTKEVYISHSFYENFEPYPILKFSSKLTLEELLTELGEPLGSEVGTNWTNDIFYDETSRWVIYNFHDMFCLIVGYDKSLQALVDEIFIKNLPIIKPASFFFELLTQYMNEQQKQDFIQESIRNNPWLKEVKVYSLPESDE